MKLLELFKGTGSVGKVFKKIYPESEIYSVDILEKYNPTFCGDIMDWDYKKLPVGHFDIIWASPECKIFSILQHGWFKTGKRGDKGKWDDKEHLNRVRLENGKYVKRVLEIIDYFKPVWWFIENPWSSAMKDLPFMKNIHSIRFDYCRYGYLYKKPTRIWTNRTNLEEHKCNCKGTHAFKLGGTSSWKTTTEKKTDPTDINERYSIPSDLIKYLF
jgi:hypothetical protein